MTVTTMQGELLEEVVEPLSRVPYHIAIIMDGNGRWAKARGLPRTEGHRHGTENLRRIFRACGEFGVKIVTIYAFSTENWSRPPAEVNMLLRIVETVIDRELDELNSSGVRLLHIGKLDGLSPNLQRKIRNAMELTQHNDRLIVNIAFNYGGRDEIVHAVRSIIQEGIPAEQVTESVLSHHMYTSDLPDPDLIIRTSGELRVSNFLLWQGAYAEYYATKTYWPDFDKAELYKALQEYARRKRRFGKTDDQLDSSEA